MSFLYPYMLWGLAGLSLPIIVHMMSRREKSIVNFGSIRFLKPSESDAARSIGLSQYLLLLLRLMFLGLICFLVAQPLLSDESEVISYWIEDGIIEGGDHQELLSQIDEDDTVQCFSFSDKAKDDCSTYSSGWQLIDHLNNQKDSTIVFSYSYLKYFKGNPVNIRPSINWNILPVKGTAQLTQRVESGGNVTEWHVSSQADRTSVIYNSEHSGIAVQNSRPLSLSFDANGDDSGERLKDIIDVIGGYLKFPLRWTSEAGDEEDADLQVQVSESIETSKSNSINWLPSYEKLKIEYASDNNLILKGELSKDEILKSNLPVILSAHFTKIYTDIENNDLRVLDPASVASIEASMSTVESVVEDKSKSIGLSWWMLVIPMFFLERLVYMTSPNS